MVIDMLGLLTLDWPQLYDWQRQPAAFGPEDLKRLHGSGVNVFHPAVEPNDPQAQAAALRWISGWNRLVDSRPDCFVRIGTAADFDRVRTQGKVGILVGFQNSDHFVNVSDVQRFRDLGQRVSQLTYNARNRIGSGCMASRDTGLSPYGAEIVEAMNRAGVAVDVSHCSERTCLDAFGLSRAPVLITHSNSRALTPHPRCKSDAVIRAMAKGGGVMGITVVSAFVANGRPATIEDVLDHFDRVARVAGVEHVGLGSDVDVDALDPRTGRVRAPYAIRGLVHARRVFDLTEGLLRRGYDERAVELMLGGNFRRALGEIWKPAPAAPPAARAAGPG